LGFDRIRRREEYRRGLAFMTRAFPFLADHGYAVLVVCVLAEHLGLPVPAVPALLAVGAVAASHDVSFGLALAAGVAAALAGDVFWFTIGRIRGAPVLGFLCRISIEPDSCVSKAKNAFARWGARSLLVAKFVPGLSIAVRPLAGIFQMRLSKFLLYDFAGAVLWVGVFLGLGFVLENQVEEAIEIVNRTGSGLAVVVLVSLAAYLTFKVVQRRRFVRKLSIARISPQELKRRLDAGEDIAIVDLRQDLDFEADPGLLPGALRMRASEVTARHREIPRDREVILYCT
jgi:membrane protein DedA with SNARE-associated domain